MATNNAINYDISANAATFSAYRSTTSVGVIGNGSIPVIPFDVATINENSVYNTGTGYFTAPVYGYYFFRCSIGFGNLTIAAPQSVTGQITLTFNGSSSNQRNRAYNQPNSIASSNTCIIEGVFIEQLSPGDTVSVGVTLTGEGGNFSDILADVTTFSGYLIF
jgi:hypothetical protein